MKIELRLFASLTRYMPAQKGTEPAHNLEVPEGVTVEELLRQLRVPLDTVKVVFVNGIHAAGSQTLREGDRVGVFPPVAGG